MRVALGRDLQSAVMGGDHRGDSGTATTAPAATTFTCDGKSYTVDALIGHVVVRATTYGVILSNTATVLTIDKWYNAADVGGAAATTPATGTYVIVAGGQPAYWMSFTENATAPGDGNTDLTGELTGFGFQRQPAVYAHTAGASTYTLSLTVTSSDATTRTIQKIMIGNASRLGRPVFITAVPSPPTLISADQLAVTETVTL